MTAQQSAYIQQSGIHPCLQLLHLAITPIKAKPPSINLQATSNPPIQQSWPVFSVRQDRCLNLVSDRVSVHTHPEAVLASLLSAAGAPSQQHFQHAGTWYVIPLLQHMDFGTSINCAKALARGVRGHSTGLQPKRQ